MSKIEDLKGFIDFPAGFKLISPSPIDCRCCGEDEDFLDSVVQANAAYPGLKIYIKSTNKFYSYVDQGNGSYGFSPDKAEFTEEQLGVLNSGITKSKLEELEKKVSTETLETRLTRTLEEAKAYSDQKEIDTVYDDTEVRTLISGVRTDMEAGDSSTLSVANSALEAVGSLTTEVKGDFQKVNTKAQELEDNINQVVEKVSESASVENKLVSGSEVEDLIKAKSPRYLTYDSKGNSFETLADLTGAQVFFYGSLAILAKDLNLGDQAQVRVDLTEGRQGKTTLYFYDPDQGWVFRQVVNETAFSESQQAALNSGITSTDVNKFRTDIAKNAEDLANEAYRAKTKETEIESKLTSEETRAKASESIISGNLSGLDTKFTGLENSVNTNTGKIASIESQLANTVTSKEVEEMIVANAGRKLTASVNADSFTSLDNLKVGPWYHAGVEVLGSELTVTDSALIKVNNLSETYTWDGQNWVLSSSSMVLTDAEKTSLSAIPTIATSLSNETSTRMSEIRRVEGLIDDKINLHKAEEYDPLSRRVGTLETDLPAVRGLAQEANITANQAYSLAQGRNKAVTFKTLADLTNSLKSKTPENVSDYPVGTTLYIEDTGISDFWVAEILEEYDSSNYGYYRLCKHEGDKLDLSGYQLKEDPSLNTTAKTVSGAINEVSFLQLSQGNLINQNKTTLESSIGAVKQITDNQAIEITNLRGDITNLGDGITGLSADIDDLKNSVQEIEEDASQALEGVLVIGELTDRLNTAESNIRSLQQLGQFVGAYDTYDSLPKTISEISSKYGVLADVNDFVTVRGGSYPEGSGISTGRVTCWSIVSVEGEEKEITWAYEFTYDTDITGKIDKVFNVDDDVIPVFDGNGGLKASGRRIGNIHSHTEDNLQALDWLNSEKRSNIDKTISNSVTRTLIGIGESSLSKIWEEGFPFNYVNWEDGEDYAEIKGTMYGAKPTVTYSSITFCLPKVRVFIAEGRTKFKEVLNSSEINTSNGDITIYSNTKSLPVLVLIEQ